MDTTTTTTAPDGRTLEIHVHGDPTRQRVVLLLHAAPGGAGLDPDPVATARHDICVVGVDRPGYGGSSPFLPGSWPSVAAAADDTLAVLDHLGLDRVPVSGWSAGGRVALAAAARHPERFTRVGVIGTPAPQAAVAWVPEHYQRLTEELAARPDADEARAGLASLMGEVLGDLDGEGHVRSITNPADAALLSDPAVLDRLVASTAHGLAPGIGGMTDDVLAYGGRPWGFEPAEVQAPTLLAYGAQDEVVTLAHGEWYASQLPDAELLRVPDVGHLVVVPAWDRILTHLVAG